MRSQCFKTTFLLFTVGLIGSLCFFGFKPSVTASTMDAAFESSQNTTEPKTTAKLSDFGNLPLAFTLNRGQINDEIKYYSNGSHYGLFLTQNGADLRLFSQNSANQRESNNISEAPKLTTGQVRLNFIGGDLTSSVVGEQELDGKVNFITGNNQNKWFTDLPTFAKVRYKSVYPGIDVVFYGNQREFEYDFVVAPKANPNDILLEFEFAQKISLNRQGELLIKLQNGIIKQRKPIAYQIINGQKKMVKVRFIKNKHQRISIRLGKYNPEHELIIDPIIIFSTYFGGNSTETGLTVKTDTQGNIYLTGGTVSTNFPTRNPLQPTIGSNFFLDAFVTKINPAGNAIIYSTYLGGASDDLGTSLSIDQAGNAVVTGRTFSPNFPTVNAYQNQIAGGADGFIAKLNPNGSALLFSTFLGGTAFDDISGSALDANGKLVIAGRTESGNFPTINPWQTTRAGSSLFRSSNAGDSWVNGIVSPANSSIASFAVNPNSPNEIFAATESGVFRSTDGGTVWTAAGQSDLSVPVSKLAVVRSNPNIIYAVANGVIYKSVNSGSNWTNIQGTIFSSLNSVQVHPQNANTVYVGGSGGSIYKSDDGGTNWTNVSIVNDFNTVYSIVIDPANPQTVFAGTSSRILKSTVGGGNWSPIMNGIPFSTTFWDLLIDSANNRIFAATQNGLYRTSDAGANWTAISTANLTTIRSLAQDPSNPSRLFAATNIGLCFRSLDGGNTWNQVNNGLSGNSLFAVAVSTNSVLLGGYAGTDAFAARLDVAGNALDFSTFLGGNLNDSAIGVRLGSDQQITLGGTTGSTNFPVVNPIQTNLRGSTDAFITKFNESGTALIYSTYLGGTSNETANALMLDSTGNAYLTGNTLSTDFPVLNAYQPTCASCGNFSADAFVTKLNATGSNIIFSTFLGGSAADNGLSLEVDSQQRIYVAGTTSSTNFPVIDAIQQTPAGAVEGFVTQMRSDGSNLIYSTFYGGGGNDAVTGLALSPEGNLVLAGQTTSSNFPTVSPLQATLAGSQDAFIAKIGVAADLEITILDERDPVMINNPLVYNLRVKNNGPSAATAVNVTDVFPAGVNFVSATPSQGNCNFNNSTLTCNLGNLNGNAQVNIRVILTPTQTGIINTTANVSGGEPDPLGGNNQDTEQTLISTQPSIFGKVADANGQPASEVGISVDGFQSRTTQTDVAGFYSLPELPLSGNYTVRPVKAGFYFTPRSKNFNSLTRDETADFEIKTCVYTISENAANFSAAGGQKSVLVTANDPFCAWTAVSNVPWISITTGNSGFGNGTVRISVQPSNAARTGTLTIAGRTFTVTQSGCIFSLMPFQQSFGQSGGTGTIEIRTSQSFCPWTAVTNDSWITINGSSSGTGNGLINYTIAPASRPRNGRINIGGQIFPVWQAFNSCPSPTFEAPIETVVSADSNDILAADFNNDMIPDLATIDLTLNQSWTLSVYLGNGSGGFNRNTLSTAIGPLSGLAAGDFNRDSNLDLAVAGAGQISIFNGNGNGGFTFFMTFSANTGIEIFSGDFDRDGKTDLLLGNNERIQVQRGNGDGTFVLGYNQLIGGRSSYSFALGDVNGDGLPDVVVGNEFDFNVPRLMYYFGSNNGTFTLGGTASLGNITPFSVKSGDFNGDGFADVVTNGYGASQVLVFLWNPTANGLGPARKVFTAPFNAYSFDIADVNNDGQPDIISASDQEYPQQISVMRGNGNGTFRLPLNLPSVKSVKAMAFADFNRDGRTDIAFAKKINQMAVQLNQCSSSKPDRPSGAVRFDFDGDRRADFSVFRPSNNTWYVHQGTNQPMLSQQFGTNGDIPVPADFDGDGKTDFAVFRSETGIWYFLHSADNSFTTFQWGQNGDIPVPADFDGDDRADIAVFRPSERTWYLTSSLNGQIRSVQFGLSSDQPVIGDFDGDGKSDLAVFRSSTGFWYWLNSSNGAFQAFQFGVRKDKPVPGDYDGDGKTDLAVYRPSENTWYLMKSSLNEPFVLNFGTNEDNPTPADFDGDGKTDLALYQNGFWQVFYSLTGEIKKINFGLPDDKPIPSIFIK